MAGLSLGAQEDPRRSRCTVGPHLLRDCRPRRSGQGGKVNTCGDCARWDSHGPREVESVTTGDCEKLKDLLYFTYYHPPYAGGSVVESVETPRLFGCSLFEPLPAPAPESKEE